MSWEKLKLFTFPTKHKWWEDSDLALIDTSMQALVTTGIYLSGCKVYMPRVGCGNGKLHWDQVRPVIQFYDELSNIVVVHP